eukprot:1140939-Pelagomonas_calceolata.AAC.6
MKRVKENDARNAYDTPEILVHVSACPVQSCPPSIPPTLKPGMQAKQTSSASPVMSGGQMGPWAKCSGMSVEQVCWELSRRWPVWLAQRSPPHDT